MEITEKEFLEMELKDFHLTMKNPNFVALASEVADFLSLRNPGTILDYGCGTGVYSEVMRQEGLDVVAMDIWEAHRNYCKETYPLLTVTDTPCKADTMVWIEVAEHMTDEEIVKALMTVRPDKILFSSTPETTPNDHLWGHINIKMEQEWINSFADLGYTYQSHPGTPTKWAMFFTRSTNCPW